MRRFSSFIAGSKPIWWNDLKTESWKIDSASVLQEWKNCTPRTLGYSQSSEKIPLTHFLDSRAQFIESLKAFKKEWLAKDKNYFYEREMSLIGSKMDEVGEGEQFTIRQLLQNGVHFGHAPKFSTSLMYPYIFGEREGIFIFDLEKTLACLRNAINVVCDVAEKGGIIVFVGTRPLIADDVYKYALECGQYYVNKRWIGGTITNRKEVLKCEAKPDLLIVFDYPVNKKALLEAEKCGIPTIAICDSDCDPSIVTYPIPANDDSASSVQLIMGLFSMAAKKGKENSCNMALSKELQKSCKQSPSNLQ